MDLTLNLNTYNIHSKLTLTRLQVILYRFEARLVTITEKMPGRQDLIDETNENIRLINSAIEFQLENNTTFFKTQFENQKLKNDYLLKCAENESLKMENEKLRTDKRYFG
jgi:hypothetical protein